MEPNPSWLLVFTFLVSSQKQLDPKLEMGLLILLLKAEGKVIDDFVFQLKSYNFRYHLQFSNKWKKMYFKFACLPPRFFPLPNFSFSIFNTALSSYLWASFSFLHLLG